MFAKLFIAFACLAIAAAAPEPKADPKADPLLVSTYSAGLPLVNTYSAAAAVPLVNTYAAHTYSHDHVHGLPVHAARTITYNTAGLRTVAIDSPVVQHIAADVPVAYSAVNPLHYTAVSSPVATAVVV